MAPQPCRCPDRSGTPGRCRCGHRRCTGTRTGRTPSRPARTGTGASTYRHICTQGGIVMPTETQKIVAGALLLGASLASGNAVLITTAGGIGVNWTSEGLAKLWQHLGQPKPPGTALTRVGEQAIQQAVETLRIAYAREVGPQADPAAFALVHDCARAVAVASYPAGPSDLLATQEILTTNL